MTLLMPNSNRSFSVFSVLLAQNTDKLASVSELANTSAKSQWSDDAAQLTELAAQGDMASLGLGGWSPVGLLQTAIDSLHTTVHLPWWAAIVTATITLRVCLIPIVVKMQRNAAILNNLRPELDKVQKRIKEYQQAGNQIMAAQEMARVLQIYKNHGCSPIKLMVMPFVQFPVFISFFFALRKMAAAPIESMKEGGALWFTDLTVPDPFYALPIMACLSFMATIEVLLQTQGLVLIKTRRRSVHTYTHTHTNTHTQTHTQTHTNTHANTHTNTHTHKHTHKHTHTHTHTHTHKHTHTHTHSCNSSEYSCFSKIAVLVCWMLH